MCGWDVHLLKTRHFDSDSSAVPHEKKKIFVMLNYCEISPSADSTCDFASSFKNDDVTTIVINVGANIADDKYSCLVDETSDMQHLYSLTSVSKLFDIIDGLAETICHGYETPQPTKDPTNKPTKKPTGKPTQWSSGGGW